MSIVETIDRVEYPESDGKPMAETDIHRNWMFRILEILRHRYRGQDVYLASDLLVYYERGNPRKAVAPDDFVVLDCDPGERRTFKIWKEGKGPDVVFEVTSSSTRKEDERKKPAIYAAIKVQEYFLYDPTGDYLSPALKGFRRRGKKHHPIKADESGFLTCNTLGITLRLEAGALVLRDRETGQRLLTEAEAAHAARQAAESDRKAERTARKAAEAALKKEQAALKKEQAARQEEIAARQAAEARAAELEAELQRLREDSKRSRRKKR